MPTDLTCEHCDSTNEAFWVKTADATHWSPAEYEATCEDCWIKTADAAREDHADHQREQ